MLKHYFHILHLLIREKRYWQFRCFSTIRLHSVALELSSHCNLSCQNCPQKQLVNLKHMPLELIQKVLNELKSNYKLKAEKLLLYNFGEPLLHPKFLQILEMIALWKKFLPADRRPIVVLTTNGMLLDGDRSSKLIETEAVDVLYVSIDGGNQSDYERMRGGGDWEKVMSNFERFIENIEQNNKKIMTGIISIFDTANPEIEPRFSSLVKRVNEYCPRGYHNWDGQQFGHQNHHHALFRTNRFCSMIMKFLVVQASGYVFPCCVSSSPDLIIGDANSKSMAEIYKGKQLNNLITKMWFGKRNELPGCQHCEL